MCLKPPFSIDCCLHQSFQHDSDMLNFESCVRQCSIPDTLDTVSSCYLPRIDLQRQFQHISIYTNQQNVRGLHGYSLPTKTRTV